jgi:hypothetical protein
VGAPSLTATKPRQRRRQLAGVETGRGGTKLHASVAGSRVTVFLATAAPWEPYFTDNPCMFRRSVYIYICFEAKYMGKVLNLGSMM